MRGDDLRELARYCLEECRPCEDCCDCSSLAASQGQHLRRWAWGLTAFTIVWNALEAVVAISSGFLAGSIALIGFGLDSVVEVSSALVIVWLLLRQRADAEANEQFERRAVRLIALSFFGIAVYVTDHSVGKLFGASEAPQYTPVGLALLALSLVVMPALIWVKRRVASGLGSVALRADAGETQVCTYLSAVVLLGVATNGMWGWWWMDSVAGLVVAGLALREGREAWTHGDLCQTTSFTQGQLASCAPACCPACPAV